MKEITNRLEQLKTREVEQRMRLKDNELRLKERELEIKERTYRDLYRLITLCAVIIVTAVLIIATG